MSAATMERTKNRLDRDEPPSTFGDLTLELMHEQLLEYGLCYLRGSAGIIGPRDQGIISWESDVGRPAPREWSQPDIERAARLHSRVIRLPLVAHRITLQVFYSESIALGWGDLDPHTKDKALRDLTYWPTRPFGVNARLARFSVESGLKVSPIHPSEFLPIMLRAIRILMNGERMRPQWS